MRHTARAMAGAQAPFAPSNPQTGSSRARAGWQERRSQSVACRQIAMSRATARRPTRRLRWVVAQVSCDGVHGTQHIQLNLLRGEARWVGWLAPGVNLRNRQTFCIKLPRIKAINLKQTAGCRGQRGGLLNRISSFCPLSLPPPASDDRGRTGRTRARRRSGAGCRSSRAGCRAGSRPTRARGLRGEAGGPSARDRARAGEAGARRGPSSVISCRSVCSSARKVVGANSALASRTASGWALPPPLPTKDWRPARESSPL